MSAARILCMLTSLSAVGWSSPSNAQSGGGHGGGSHGSAGSASHGSHEEQARSGTFRSEYILKPLAVMVDFHWYLFPDQPPTGLAAPFVAPGVVVGGGGLGGANHLAAGQSTDHLRYQQAHHFHFDVQSDQGRSIGSQHPGENHAQDGHANSAAAQSAPGAGSVPAVTLGDLGPGRLVPGQIGPGMPGPGQPPGPRP